MQVAFYNNKLTEEQCVAYALATASYIGRGRLLRRL